MAMHIFSDRTNLLRTWRAPVRGQGSYMPEKLQVFELPYTPTSSCYSSRWPHAQIAQAPPCHIYSERVFHKPQTQPLRRNHRLESWPEWGNLLACMCTPSWSIVSVCSRTGTSSWLVFWSETGLSNRLQSHASFAGDLWMRIW